MYDEVAPTSDWEKKRQEREKAMLKRLNSLPKDNPIAKMAVKHQKADMNQEQSWEQFKIVDELVSAARKCVADGDDFNEAVSNLADALQSLVDKKSSKTDDNVSDE